MSKETPTTDDTEKAIQKAADKNVEALQFNPCLGVEYAVLDLQKRVKALEDKVG
jgi:hypothetical protein